MQNRNNIRNDSLGIIASTVGMPTYTFTSREVLVPKGP